MFVKGVVGSEPVLASVGPDVRIETVQNAVLCCSVTFIPLGT
jgi:hypothetical protein